MNDIERSASFYLGKLIDPDTGQLGEILQYDARDLTTHAVCVGMTGSGKTGLCIGLLEEAAMDGIPSIIIDPKGDITNMLLTFPELRPEDFLPWVNIDDARRKDMTPEAYAERTAKQWAEGLEQWQEGPERIRKLRESAEFTIFTPGSDAGVPVSILQALAVPDLSWDDHEEMLREKIAGTVSALLQLVGVDGQSIHSREHVLLSNILEVAWRAAEDMDLPKLILQIQNPPIRKLGVFDVDAYFPPGDRMQLAMALNNIIAAPSFQSWLEGMPLDIPRVIRSSDGRPRVSIFYIAHLSDAERMFFVSLLLQQVQTWMRTLSGTTSLRCLVYFDEVFGYFPPHPANPPSKIPLLTLLKQARAFGVGVILVTQNPVDLDYKGLTNAGTWFIGKLQTDRDKMRVLEGLEGVASQEGAAFDRGYFDRLIGKLKTRVFILHNVHQEGPVVFNTRWAMSYLRGPLTRSQVRRLMQPVKEQEGDQGGMAMTDEPPRPSAAEARPAATGPALAAAPPTFSDKIKQYFLPVTVAQAAALRQANLSDAQATLLYEPALIGLATVRYVHSASRTDVQQQVSYVLPAEQIGVVPDWSQAEWPSVQARDLDTQTYAEARFEEVPQALGDPAQVKKLEKSFSDFLYHNRQLVISYNRALKVYAEPGDSEGDFRARCQEVARQKRDDEAQKVAARYQTKIDRLQERIQREEQELESDRAEYDARKQEEVLSAGESLLGLVLGRRRSTALSKASRKRRLTKQAKLDIEESVQALERLKQELADLKGEMDQALAELDVRWADKLEEVEEVRVTPRRTDIMIEAYGMVWIPAWELAPPGEGGARRLRIPAYARA